MSVARANFSVAEAFASGVAVIERSFRNVVLWAAATFAITLSPAVLIFLLKGGRFSVPDGGRSLQTFRGGDPGVLINQFHRVIDGGFWAYLLLGLIWATFGGAVVQAAVYRSVLKPGRDGAGWLRLGPTEIWLFLLMIVETLGVLVLLTLWMAVAFVWMLVGKIVGPPAGGWIGGAGMLVATVLFVWVMIRFSLAGAMTVAEGRFRFFGSWSLTQGRSWKLFWTFFLIVALARGLELLSAAAVVLLNGTALEPIPVFLVPFELIWLAVVSLVVACLRALVLAPLATAYRGLSSAPA